MNKTELTRADALIITVGTRQVGWRCKDQVIRCFGADGDRGHPPHINQLYTEIGIQRGFHQPGQTDTSWGVRDLGERYYQHCTEWLENDFTSVELLLDYHIIVDSISKGLQRIILWATDQPEAIPWKFRRADTIWLAKLMQGKINAISPQVQVDVLHPAIAAVNRDLLRQELEEMILPLAFESVNIPTDSQLVLLIENKGAVPAMAEGLEICAAALVRSAQVINATPEEPNPLYLETVGGFFSSRLSEQYQLVPVSSYFWPLERGRVISAWERGDFREAEIWLSAHQIRHKVLYQLAGYLSLATNWEIDKFLNNPHLENGWFRSKALLSIVSQAQVDEWRSQILARRNERYLKTWESVFLIEVMMATENYTNAFLKFAQVVEQLLYLVSKQGEWLQKGLIVVPEHQRHYGDAYQPNFDGLIKGWCQLKQASRDDNRYKLLNAIRDKRNKVVHEGEPMTVEKLRLLWANNGYRVTVTSDYHIILNLMLDVLKMISDSSWQIPQKTLLRSLSEFGLNTLRSEAATT
jgi:hypothetical protein